MAAYGSQIAQGKSEDEALDFVAAILENTPVQDASARDSLQTFIGGKGDVFLSYENEAIGAIRRRRGARVLVPDETILIETQVGGHDRGRRSRGSAGVPRLPAHRRRPARLGRERATARSTRRSSPSTRTSSRSRKDLFTIEEFGGWETVATEFFDPDEGSVAEIERNLGVATE